MILAQLSPEQVGTWIAGVLLAAGTVWNSRRAKSAETKVEQRTQHVDDKLEHVQSTAETATDTARSAARTAEEARRQAADMERMAAIITGISASNDDLRSAYRDVKYELTQTVERDRQCQAQLLLLRQEKTAQDEVIATLKREVTGFAAQVAQLTDIVNHRSST